MAPIWNFPEVLLTIRLPRNVSRYTQGMVWHYVGHFDPSASIAWTHDPPTDPGDRNATSMLENLRSTEVLKTEQIKEFLFG